MSTVPNAPEGGWDQRFDLVRRRDEYADVFATRRVRPEVEAVAAWARRGVADLGRVRELFTERGEALVPQVRALDRDGLREAYSLLLLEEPMITRAIAEFLSSVGTVALPFFVVDAIGHVIVAATRVERLARAWAWFLSGDVAVDE